MLGVGGRALQDLKKAVSRLIACPDSELEPADLRVQIDRLEARFCSLAQDAVSRGDHLRDANLSPVSWLARSCHMSATSAADRLCAGEQLRSLPAVSMALDNGEIGYQSAAVLCHLRDQLGDKRDLFDEQEMLGFARRFSVKGLRELCRYARHVADPDGFFDESEEANSQRRLRIAQMPDGMHAIEGLLDPEGGAALKSALDGLARKLGAGDERSHRQRMADALGEMALHALDGGSLRRRNGVRPHLSVTTTLDGLRNLPGAPAADLEHSLPISTRTVERLACDATVSRVVMADSVVVDVGRATRVVSGATHRALRLRDRGCRWPGCERPAGWTQAHHIEFWTRGGKTELGNLVLLCHHHHRQVHEGGWQVVKHGRELRFIPPDRAVMRKARGPGLRWAA